MNKIYPIEAGRFQQMQKTNFTYTRNQGEKIKASVWTFLIETPNELIMVDTGPSTSEWAEKHHHPMARKGTMAEALKNAGFCIDDVSTVINTHLHWDHATNNHEFANAKILVQEEELKYAANPLPVHYTYYECEQIGLTPPWLNSRDRMEVIKGDYHVADGVDILLLPGHTPGFQGVLVDTANGKYLLAGDCLPLYENWKPVGFYKYLPSGIHCDLFAYYDSLHRIEKLTQEGVKIVPGHDVEIENHPEIIEKRYFG